MLEFPLYNGESRFSPGKREFRRFFFRNLNSPDLFVEGWDGLFIWPEDIPRAEPHRERWGTLASGFPPGRWAAWRFTAFWGGLWGSGMR